MISETVTMPTLLQTMLERLKGSNAKKCTSSHSCRCRQFIEKNRLLIFKDHHSKGRHVMYDSLASNKDAASNSNRKSTSVKLVGEMMFGSAPMPQKVSTLKVHTIQNPPQLMVTKVFAPTPSNCESSGEHESFDFYSIQSADASSNDCTCRVKQTVTSVPVTVPGPLTSSYCEDSGFSASASSSMSSQGPSPSGSFAVLSSSNSSRSRRLQRHQTTTLEYRAENSLHSEPVELVPLAKRPVKIGVGILFMLDEDNLAENERFLNFFFSHIMLIESYVHKLKQSIDKALLERSRSVIHSALEKFFKSVYSLYSAPRIVEPVWLSMITSSPRRTCLCSRFFNDLMFFVERYDTKSTNFFLSSLLTGVLTHHLSWTQTVAPVGSGLSKTYLDKFAAKWLNSLGRSHPYNPLWAQLGDLYGAIGFPRRLSRTVVIGKNKQLVRKLLSVLSYFIRCSEILESKESFPLSSSALPSPSDSLRTVSFSNVADMCHSTVHERTALPSPSDSLRTVSFSNVADMCHSTVHERTALPSPSDSLRTVSFSNVTEMCHSTVHETTVCIENHRSNRTNNIDICDRITENSGVFSEKMCHQLSHEKSLSSGPQSLMLYRSDVPVHILNLCEKVEDSVGLPSNGLNYVETSPIFSDKIVRHSSDDDSFCERIQKTKYSELTCVQVESTDDLPCRLSDKVPDEDVKIEINSRVRREAVLPLLEPQFEPHQQDKFLRVGLVKDSSSRPCLRPDNLDLPVKNGMESRVILDCVASESSVKPKPTTVAGNSNEHITSVAPMVERGCSMFDEYFDDSSLPVNLDISSEPYCHSFDEIIMNEPCPDVSHIVTPSSRLVSSGSSACIETLTPSVASVELIDSSTNFSSEVSVSTCVEDDRVSFVETHFALSGDNLNDVPDGPSKRMICSTIELMHEVCVDRASLKSFDGAEPAADYLTQWATEPAVMSRRMVHHRSPSSGSMACRPLTPSTEAIRPQRLSTTSSDLTCIDSCDHLFELEMPPCSELFDDSCALPSHDSNFGRSLMADYCESYQSDFVLHGTGDRTFLKDDLHQDLQMTLKNSVLDEPVDEASCIVADIDTCTVKLYSCKYNMPKELKSQELIPSQLVGRILETCQEFCKMNVTSEFCLMHIEDQLQSIYVKSEMLAEFINIHHRLYHQELMTLHGFDLSDMPLLLAVASTHSPHLLLSLTDSTVCRGKT